MKTFASICLIAVLILVPSSCGNDEKVCCTRAGKSALHFSQLPLAPLPTVFTVDKVTAIRLYGEIKREGTSLRLRGWQEVPPGSGNKKDAALMLLFSQLSCRVCAVTAEVHGHGNEARIVATQRDGTTQTAVCSGGKQILTLDATRDNPFIWVIISGQEAEWLFFRLE